MYIDRFMLLDKHIHEITQKVTGTLMLLSRLSATLDKSTQIIVVQSLVISIINYCIRILGTANQTVLNAAQKLQNFAAKVAISGAKKYDHVTPIIKQLKWVKVKRQYQLVTCTAVFKTLNDFYPIWLKFPSVRDVTNNITRQQNFLYVRTPN